MHVLSIFVGQLTIDHDDVHETRDTTRSQAAHWARVRRWHGHEGARRMAMVRWRCAAVTAQCGAPAELYSGGLPGFGGPPVRDRPRRYDAGLPAEFPEYCKSISAQ